MKVIIIIILVLGAISLINFYVYPLWMYYIKGKKRYKSETLLSMGGIAESYNWFKSDEEAIKVLGRRDFIYRVYPGKEEMIKPKS